MLRLLASLVVHLIANAVAFLIATLVLPGFSVDTATFIIAVVIFSLLEVVLGPLIFKISFRYVPALTGGVALVVTLVGLILTDLLSDGLSISGFTTWILGTLIVWLGGLLAGLLLPLVIFKKTLAKRGK